MDLTPLMPAERQVIEAYGSGGFRVSGTVHTGSIIVLPDATTPWPVASPDALDIASLAAVIAAEPPVELLLVGFGARMAMVPVALREELRTCGIVIEAMDTGAACRTYNVLLAEERRIAAALIAVA